LVKSTKFIIFTYLYILIFIGNAWAIESAAHKVEVAKCLGIVMTIKNNSSFEQINIDQEFYLLLYLFDQMNYYFL
jgi:hypothetical protein